MVGDVEGLGWEGVGTGLGKASLQYGPFPNPQKHKKQSHILKFPRHVNRFQIALFRAAPPAPCNSFSLNMAPPGCPWGPLRTLHGGGGFVSSDFTYFNKLVVCCLISHRKVPFSVTVLLLLWYRTISGIMCCTQIPLESQKSVYKYVCAHSFPIFRGRAEHLIISPAK